MADYISREEALMAVTRAKLPDTTPKGVPIANGKRSVTDCIRRIKEIPSADVVERKEGKWIDGGRDGPYRHVICSECGYDFGNFHWGYCPNCGARMEEE